jgi:glutathione peroxidase
MIYMNRKVFSVVKKSAFILVGFTGILLIYVFIDNGNNKDMTFRQKILKTFYPFLMKIGSSNKTIISNTHTEPPVSFYTLEATSILGDSFHFEQLKGKKVLIVNTASDCGYTPQYEELQQLYEKHKDQLEILAFPSNDYKQQEKGKNEDIAVFCKKNYGVSFPLMGKTVTKKTTNQYSVYQWLTDPAKNGWNKKAPKWNFSKYLINEKGQLTHYFGPSVSTKDEEFLRALNQ